MNMSLGNHEYVPSKTMASAGKSKVFEDFWDAALVHPLPPRPRGERAQRELLVWSVVRWDFSHPVDPRGLALIGRHLTPGWDFTQINVRCARSFTPAPPRPPRGGERAQRTFFLSMFVCVCWRLLW